MPSEFQHRQFFDFDEGTVVEGNRSSYESDSDTNTETTETETAAALKARSWSIGSDFNNTGAQIESEYLKETDESEDPYPYDISETFFRDHYSIVNPPEPWISIQDFLDAEASSGKETDCGKYLRGFKAKVPSIEAEASRLRKGMPCCLDVKQFNKGAFNIVMRIFFSDYQVWVCRILVPEVLVFTDKERAAQQDIQIKSLASQLGSMRYVREHTKIRVPEIYGYDFSNSSVAGAPYMFMELVQGMSIKKWLEENRLTKEKATEFYQNLADLMWEFYSTRFDKIGELQFDDEGNVTVGGFFDSRTRSMYGPFTSAHEFLIQRQQKLWEFRVLAERRNTAVIGAGKKHWHELEQDVKDIFIAWLYREVAPFAQTEFEAAYENLNENHLNAKSQDYVLFHADLSISNILVDEDLRIMAVIDWDWTASLPISSFDPLPFDMGYETLNQFPGGSGPQEHEVFDHKELYYSIWENLERERDPEGRLGRSLVPARIGQDHISTILNRYAWTYCIERTNKTIFEKLRFYKGQDTLCWGCLIERFRLDWLQTKGSYPTWWENIRLRIQGLRRPQT